MNLDGLQLVLKSGKVLHGEPTAIETVKRAYGLNASITKSAKPYLSFNGVKRQFIREICNSEVKRVQMEIASKLEGEVAVGIQLSPDRLEDYDYISGVSELLEISKSLKSWIARESEKVEEDSLDSEVKEGNILSSIEGIFLENMKDHISNP